MDDDTCDKEDVAELFAKFHDDFEKCGWKCTDTLEALQANHNACFTFLVKWGRPSYYRPDKGLIIEDKPSVKCGTVQACLTRPEMLEYLRKNGHDIATEMALAVEEENNVLFEDLMPHLVCSKNVGESFSLLAVKAMDHGNIRVLEQLSSFGWVSDDEIIEAAVEKNNSKSLRYLLGLYSPSKYCLNMKIIKRAFNENDEGLFSMSSTTLKDLSNTERASIIHDAISSDRGWVLGYFKTLEWNPDDETVEKAVTSNSATSLCCILDWYRVHPAMLLRIVEMSIINNHMILFEKALPKTHINQQNLIALISADHAKLWALKNLRDRGWEPKDEIFRVTNSIRGKTCLHHLLEWGFQPKSPGLLTDILKRSVEFSWHNVAREITRHCTSHERDDRSYILHAAFHGDVEMLMVLHERGWKWHPQTCVAAVLRKSRECFDYAQRNGCPGHPSGSVFDLPGMTSKKASELLLKKWVKGNFKILDKSDDKTIVHIMPGSIIVAYVWTKIGKERWGETLPELRRSMPLPYVWERVNEIVDATRSYIWCSLNLPIHVHEDIQYMVWDRLPARWILKTILIAYKSERRRKEQKNLRDGT
jgi:hypothetical protein